MAKIPMLCPFSKELCRECTVYRGRHYYLCFRKEYGGYLGKKGQIQGLGSENTTSVVITGRQKRQGRK
jgi:hypothetical protein